MADPRKPRYARPEASRRAPAAATSLGAATAPTPNSNRPDRPDWDNAADDLVALRARARRAWQQRDRWQTLWQECYALALPQRDTWTANPGERRTDRLYDGTAPDAVDQLAASLLAQLTPPWSAWFGFAPGPELQGPEADPAERAAAARVLQRMGEALQGQIDRSNFAVEIHQCFLDLVVGGSACLLVEETAPGSPVHLRFRAVPLAELALEEGAGGRPDTVFRRVRLSVGALRRRFPDAALPDALVRDLAGQTVDERDAAPVTLLEAALPLPAPAIGYRHVVALEDPEDAPALIDRRVSESPFIAFRWIKAPGETYGRSPVMKALPDIKTANKVVELVLKNATIAVTGIWQADDDGVLNPATVRLVPGTIIPKAVGSSGLTPLEAPGKFDVSELVLQDLRTRIRHALLADQLAQINAPRMTATEVLERAAQMARLLGATYGRLQAELLTPLLLRCLDVLRRRGAVPDIAVDGRLVELQHRSPLAQAQAQRDVQATLLWLEALAGLGPEAQAVADGEAAARWLARRYGVPAELLHPPPPDPMPGVAPADLEQMAPERPPDTSSGPRSPRLTVAPGPSPVASAHSQSPTSQMEIP